MVRFSPKFKTSVRPHTRRKRVRIRILSALGICALVGLYGMLYFFLNVAGHDYLLGHLMSEGHRIYPVGFEDSHNPLDMKTVDAVQTVENFLDDVPCDDNWSSKRCYSDIVAFARDRQKKGTVVLAVATAGNYAVALNWCLSLLQLSIDNFMIVALDDESFQFFANIHAPVIRLPAQQQRFLKKDIWIRRTLLTYMILRSGINVLVSDFDAISVKSPFKSRLYSFEDPSMDIITTPSNFPNPSKDELPEECRIQTPRRSSQRHWRSRQKHWRSNMEWIHQPCMGWTFFRSSDRMRRFFEDKLLYDVIKFWDDQIGFNCAIRRAGAVWKESQYGERWRGMRTSTSSPQLTILMLPASRYVRNCTAQNHNNGRKPADHKYVELYHCKGYQKEENARSNGFWFVRDDWDKVERKQADFGEYLREISALP